MTDQSKVANALSKLMFCIDILLMEVQGWKLAIDGFDWEIIESSPITKIRIRPKSWPEDSYINVNLCYDKPYEGMIRAKYINLETGFKIDDNFFSAKISFTAIDFEELSGTIGKIPLKALREFFCSVG